jgi:hypothetical protein
MLPAVIYSDVKVHFQFVSTKKKNDVAGSEATQEVNPKPIGHDLLLT